MTGPYMLILFLSIIWFGSFDFDGIHYIAQFKEFK